MPTETASSYTSPASGPRGGTVVTLPMPQMDQGLPGGSLCPPDEHGVDALERDNQSGSSSPRGERGIRMLHEGEEEEEDGPVKDLPKVKASGLVPLPASAAASRSYSPATAELYRREPKAFYAEEIHEPEYYERTGKPVPEAYNRYLESYGTKKGPAMYKAMLRWRQENSVDTILEEPHLNAAKIKEGAPHYLYGKTKTDSWVSYELNGLIEPSKLKKLGIRPEHIERNITWIQEFSRIQLDGGGQKTYMVVMDMKGFSLLKAASLLVLSITKTYGETLASYYAGVLERLVVVNPPFGSQTLQKILLPLLPSFLKERLIILSDVSGLQEWIDPEQIPVQYGGLNTTPLCDSEPERKMRAYLQQVNNSTTTTNGNGEE